MEKVTLARPRCRWEHNIKKDSKNQDMWRCILDSYDLR